MDSPSPFRRSVRRGRAPAFGVRLEELDDRALPSTFTVTTTADGGAGSLRQAILDANASAGVADRIEFAIGSGVQTIQPATALPSITDAVEIDGTTQPGFAGAPLIELTGTAAPAAADGLVLSAAGCTVRGLVVNGFGGQGVEVGSDGNVIAGNYIGTNVAGTAAVRFGPPNGTGYGIYIRGTSNNVIGGTSAADRNLISGNRGPAVYIGLNGAGGNQVLGNYLGTDVTGTMAVGNAGPGVQIDGTNATANVIGGAASGAGNLISGNASGFAIDVSATASGTVIQGNLVGVNAAGTKTIPAVTGGIIVLGPGTVIGGASPGARNVVAGSPGAGVTLGGNAGGSVVQGNYLGTDVTGTLSLPNKGAGVSVTAVNDTAVLDNVIRNNGGSGVDLRNVIRTTVSGNTIRLNAPYGIRIRSDLGVSADNVIDNNWISANASDGIFINGFQGTLTGTVIRGNRIGTNSSGTAADPNGNTGVEIGNSSNNVIGGTSAADRNVISGNGGTGVSIGGPEILSLNNSVLGNYIGVDVTGTRPLGNQAGGVGLGFNTRSNVVGGTAPGAANVIAGNQLDGVAISQTSLNRVIGNFIGTDETGTLDLGNGRHGVCLVNSATANQVGGLAPGEANVVAYNVGAGVFAGKLPNSSTLAAAGNAILSNAIFANQGIGIDLGPDDGPTPNDSLGHVGPNNYQNFPALASGFVVGGVLTVSGTVSSAPNTTFTVQFFANDAADATGFGEGQRNLGSAVVTTDAAGLAALSASFASGFSVGQVVSATATAPDGSTSEFSAAVAIVAGNEPPAVTVLGPATGLEDGGAAGLAVSVADPDAGAGAIAVTVSVPAAAGVLTASVGGGGATVTGSGSATVMVTGQLAAVNAALATLQFVPAADVNGLVPVTVVANDQGNTGPDGPKTATRTFNVAVTAVNDAPSFSAGGPVMTLEDAGPQAVAGWATSISAGPADEAGQALTFTASADDTALFLVQPAIDPTTGNLTYTPAPNATGTATVTVRLLDNGGTANNGSASSGAQTFTITVAAVNDPPAFAVGGNQTVNEDAAPRTVVGFLTGISAGPADEAAQAVAFQMSNTNTAIFSVQPTVDAAGTLTYALAPNANGSATVTVIARDNGGVSAGGVDASAPQTFTITAVAVNDPPSFVVGPNQIQAEDAGARSVANFLTGISAGPADEAPQGVAFTVTNDNTALFSAQPGIDAAGVLRYTLAADANGTATVTVTAVDNGGTANGGVNASAAQTFTISVTPVNDAPAFSLGAAPVVPEDSGPRVVADFLTALSTGPADESGQSATVTVTNDNTALFSAQPGIDATGNLSFTPAADANGTATVTVAVRDSGGTAAGGADARVKTFTVTVTAVNDPPKVTVNVPETPVGGPGPQVVPGVVSVASGAANESDPLTVGVAVQGTTGSLQFSTPPRIDAAGTLTYAARPGTAGTATLAVTVSDGLATAPSVAVTIRVGVQNQAPLVGYAQFVVGSDAGGTGVRFFNADQSPRFSSTTVAGTERGARVATGDFNGDGVADVVVGSGPGQATSVQVLDGTSQHVMFSVQPFEASFTGGVYVAAGDLNGDGVADLVITPDEGGGPRVRVFTGQGFGVLADFFGIDDPNFRGGARAAVGDLMGDGTADLAVVAGFGGGPRVAGFDGKSLGGVPRKLFNDFFAFEQGLRNGVFIAIGDVNGDGFADVVAGGGPGGGPRVTVFDGRTLIGSAGADLVPVANFFGGDPANRGGIRVGVKNLDKDTKADVIVGSGAAAGSKVTAYLGATLTTQPAPTAAFAFDAFDTFAGGVFVG